MNKKILFELLVFCIIVLVACSNIDISKNRLVNNIDETKECKRICNSHKWAYEQDFLRGGYNSICYCVDEKGAVWSFQV